MIKVSHVFSGRISKKNETLEDCQDHLKIQGNRFAISDGSSQSFYSSIWAELLVTNFCNIPIFNIENLEEWLYPIQEEWFSQVKKRVSEVKLKNLPSWIDIENKFNRFESATATFIGLQISEIEINAMIIGDSCLFIWEADKLLQVFPPISASDFNDRPQYLASYRKSNLFSPLFISQKIKSNVTGLRYYILATDALSEWIISNNEKGNDVLSTLLNLSDQSDFEIFVESERNSKDIKLKNDDVAIIVIKASITTDEAQDWKYDLREMNVNQKESLNYDFLPKEVGQQITSTISIQPVLKKKSKNIFLKKPIFKGFILIVFFFVSWYLYNTFMNKKHTYNNYPKNKNTIIRGPKIDSSKKDSTSGFYFTILKHSLIYAFDTTKNIILIPLTKNEIKGTKIFENDKWIKFEVDLYAYKNSLNPCHDCEEDEIELNLKSNIRISDSLTKENDNLFGELKRKAKFKKISLSKKNQWYKFKFEGFIKKR